MIAPLCLFMLFAASDAYHITHHRDDQVAILEPSTKTSWGDWRQAEYCNASSYAYAFEMNVGNPKQPDDDTGVNGIVLLCRPRFPNQNYQIASMYKNWGKWQKKLSCPGQSNFLTGVSIKSQSKQWHRDDTAGKNMGCSHVDS
ncbi:Vitelline membrane outer layer protein 1-like [Exaiptasia diaphana]|nr:Vitelline membrane outer layer protein 1-like [Exaiptasia diaphana]